MEKTITSQAAQKPAGFAPFIHCVAPCQTQQKLSFAALRRKCNLALIPRQRHHRLQPLRTRRCGLSQPLAFILSHFQANDVHLDFYDQPEIVRTDPFRLTDGSAMIALMGM